MTQAATRAGDAGAAGGSTSVPALCMLRRAMSAETPLPVYDRPPAALGTVVFLVSGFVSHVYSTLGLARRLRNIGYAVEYWAESSLRRTVTAQGFELHEISPTWACHEHLLVEGWKEGLRNIRATLRCLRAARERRRLVAHSIADLELAIGRQLSRCTPDLVLVDPMLVAYVPLLQARRLRCVLLQDKPWPGRDSLAPPPTSGFTPRDTRGARIGVTLLWAWEQILVRTRQFGNATLGWMGFYTCHQLLPAVLRHLDARQKPKARRRVAYDLYIDGLEEWVLGAPQVDLPRSRPLPQGARYVGLWPDLQRKQAHFSLPRAREGSYLLYVAMGLSMPSWRDDLALIGRIVEGLHGIPNVTVIVSAGNVKAFTALRPLSKQAHIAPFLPQLACLQQADLAIIHGGANTYRECIATSTPMLVFPRDYDQHGNAARVVRLGLGMRGSRKWDTPATIRHKVVQILEDEAFARRARALNESLRVSDPHLLESAMHAVLKTEASACAP